MCVAYEKFTSVIASIVRTTMPRPIFAQWEEENLATISPRCDRERACSANRPSIERNLECPRLA